MSGWKRFWAGLTTFRHERPRPGSENDYSAEVLQQMRTTPPPWHPAAGVERTAGWEDEVAFNTRWIAEYQQEQK